MVVEDLRIYAEPLRGRVFHYRESNDREIDAVIEFPGGAWIACEIKLGAGAVDEAAESLKRAIADIGTDRIGEPAAIVVITGYGFGYEEFQDWPGGRTWRRAETYAAYLANTDGYEVELVASE